MNISSAITPGFPVQTIQKDKTLPVAFSEIEKQAISGKEMNKADYTIPENDRFFNRSFYGFWRIK